MGCFVAATQGWLLTRNRWYETILLLLICFTLFRPAFWLDRITPPFMDLPPSSLTQVAESLPQGQTLRVRVASQSRAGEDVSKVVRLTMGAASNAAERLRGTGLTLATLGGKSTIQLVRFGSEAAKYGLSPGDEITAVVVPTERPDRYWFTLPALLLLAGIIVLQRRRRSPRTSSGAPAESPVRV
jgi:hypothetical protein